MFNNVENLTNNQLYIITFEDSVKDMTPIVEQLKSLNCEIDSVQKFIGTAIIKTSADNISQLKLLPGIKAITENSVMKAI